MNSHQKESWFRAVTRSAAQIRQRFGVPDQAMEARMVRVFRAALRPRMKAGRKPERETAQAAEMWTAGMEDSAAHLPRPSPRLCQRVLWQQIYREVFPDFARMDKLTRQYRTGTLRRNVKACLRRQGCKWSRNINVPTAKRTRKRVVFSSPSVPAE
jgi:hypothetical protein